MAGSAALEGRRVWDFPTRLFHWALVALVLASVLSGGEDGWPFALHVISGHLILLLLVFRLIWGFVGSPRSRFTDFVKPPGTILTYALGALRGHPARSVGHNPLGGLMVLGFLIVLPAILVTGLGHAREEGFELGSPLSQFAPAALGHFHEPLVWMLYAMVAVHVAAVFVDWWLTGDNLIAAMLTGRKRGAFEGPAEAPLASRRTLVAAIVPVLLLGAWVFSAIRPAQLAAADAEDGGRRRRGRNRGGDRDDDRDDGSD